MNKLILVAATSAYVAWAPCAVLAQLELEGGVEVDADSGVDSGAEPQSAPGAESSPPPAAQPSPPPAPEPASETTPVQGPEPASVGDEVESASDASGARAGTRGGLGIAPGTAQTGDLVVTSPDAPVQIKTGSTDEWEFQFHGFMRVPLRVGIGNAATTMSQEQDGPAKLHLPPQIPDGTFTDWQYTNVLPGPWTELRFSYGNSRVTANVQIGAYNVSDASYRNLQAQLGINEAFITIDWSDLFGDRGGLLLTAGGFSNRYGAAGKYDAGKYDTYLFGRTHIAGETLTAFYDISDDLTLTFEHGIGGKLEAAPLIAGLPEPSPPYLPYPGPVQQGGTLLHHAHAGLTYDRKLTFALHYLTSWTDDARPARNEVDGRITSIGAELKLDGGIYGEGFIGFAHLDSKDPLRLGPALELLHSNGGWNLRDNFFGNTTAGNGTVDTLLWQYTYSFATLLHHPNDFWGQSPDLLVTTFGMLNLVDGKDPDFSEPEQKLKLGGEVTYTALSWLAASLRYDLVQPDMDDNTRSFHVLSPKLILRSDFLAHEQVVLQYSRYFYGDNTRTAWPHTGLVADEDAFMLSAIIWW